MSCTPTPSASTAEISSPMPAPQNYADSVAVKAYEALDGNGAFAALPLIQFNFGFDRGGEKSVGRRHLWNKHTGDYRIEYSVGTDSSYVVMFNVDTKEGATYMNGIAVDEAENGKMLESAYSSYINDTYWLLAPMKMMDPGVLRTHVADSSNATTDVVKLAFQGVGLTPGDQYWMYVDKASGRLARWAFVLQGNPDAAPRAFDWEEYVSFTTEQGEMSFSTRKQSLGGPFALLTDGVKIFNEAPEGMMTNPNAMLD